VKLILFFQQKSVDFTKIEKKFLSRISLEAARIRRKNDKNRSHARTIPTVQIKEVFSPFATKKIMLARVTRLSTEKKEEENARSHLVVVRRF
jgi:hypothetical protein